MQNQIQFADFCANLISCIAEKGTNNKKFEIILNKNKQKTKTNKKQKQNKRWGSNSATPNIQPFLLKLFNHCY